MADVRPINALHYDLAKVGSLDAVAAPPYDVIDAAGRQALLARSPYNAVAIDLPKPFDPADPDHDARRRPLRASARDDRPLARRGRPGRRRRARLLGADPGLRPPPTATATAATASSAGSGSRTTRAAPCARTSAPTPARWSDRLELTRATLHNLSPIFSLSTEDAWPLVEPALQGEPWGEATDEDGTVNRVWRVADPAIVAAVTERLAGAQLLIADGHHRYETARAYRDEVGGEGPLELHADVADRARRPRPARLPHPPPARPSPATPSGWAGSAPACASCSRSRRSSREEIDPAGEEGVGVFGLYDSFHKQAYRLRLKDIAALDRRLEGKPEAYRRLDSAILETLVLKGLAGMSDHDIDARNGLEYAKSVDDALARVDSGEYDVALIQRRVPVEQVKAVAETDENMPPKSTYFFPKVMTGFVFNPVA